MCFLFSWFNQGNAQLLLNRLSKCANVRCRKTRCFYSLPLIHYQNFKIKIKKIRKFSKLFLRHTATKMKFSKEISSVNVTKSAGNFFTFTEEIFKWKTLFFVQWHLSRKTRYVNQQSFMLALWVGDPINFHSSFFVKNYYLNLNFFQVPHIPFL